MKIILILAALIALSQASCSGTWYDYSCDWAPNLPLQSSVKQNFLKIDFGWLTEFVFYLEYYTQNEVGYDFFELGIPIELYAMVFGRITLLDVYYWEL